MAATVSTTQETIVVYVNGVASQTLLPLVIEKYAGGRQLDRATLEYYSSYASWTPLASITAIGQPHVGRSCRIVQNTSGGLRCVHWGVIQSAEIELGEDERLVFNSALKEFHFGVPTQGMLERNPATGNEEYNRNHIVFNPRIDGRILFNKSKAGLRFLDPKGTRTVAAWTYQGSTAEQWTAATAIQWLCSTLNKNEVWVANPSQLNLDGLPTSEAMRDVKLPHGLYLPEVLDRILDPLGYTWCIDMFDALGKPQIVIFKRGIKPNVAGRTMIAETPVYLAAAGSNFVGTSNDAFDIQLQWDASAAVNAVAAFGSFHRLEATFELFPAWKPADDTLSLSELAMDSDRTQTDPSTARVWREWVLNEGGDYIGLRAGMAAPYNLAALFGYPVIAKRRRFLPTVTLRPDDDVPAGEVHGTFIEYTIDNGATWTPIEAANTNVQILDKECGIRFDTLMVPVLMQTAGYPNARVRITASIESDDRLAGTSDGTGPTSPLNEVNFQLVDVEDSYARYTRHASSVLNSKVGAGATQLRDGQQDDQARADAFAKELVDNWNIAKLSARIRIAGIPSREGKLFQVGDVITKIQGREISFALTPGLTPKHPQVVGVQYNWQEQTQTLIVESHHSPGVTSIEFQETRQQASMRREAMRAMQAVRPW